MIDPCRTTYSEYNVFIFISMRASAVLINGSLSVLILPEVEDKFPIKF